MLGKQRRLLCLSRPCRRSRSRQGREHVYKRKIALRSQLCQKLGKSTPLLLRATSLTPPFFSLF